MSQRLYGLIAAPFTVMSEDGSINLDKIEKQAESLVKNGVKGAFICGTTGEGVSLTVAERMKITERWMEVAQEDFAVIVHVGHACLPDSRLLAAHAQKMGAHSIGTMPPFFFKPTSIEALIPFCAEVAAAAPDLPFYYYHIPAMTGVELPMLDFLKSGADLIPNLAGIKYSHNDLMDMSRCVNLDDGKYNILFGRDEILLSALSFGVDGAVGSTYNYMAPVYQRMIKAYEAGDMATARKEQARAQDVIALLHKYGGIPAGKYIMELIGLDCGGVRSPLQSLSEEQCNRLRKELDHVGMFNFCSKI